MREKHLDVRSLICALAETNETCLYCSAVAADYAIEHNDYYCYYCIQHADSAVAMLQLKEMDRIKTVSKLLQGFIRTKRHRQLPCRIETIVVVIGRFGFSCDFAIVHGRTQNNYPKCCGCS